MSKAERQWRRRFQQRAITPEGAGKLWPSDNALS